MLLKRISEIKLFLFVSIISQVIFYNQIFLNEGIIYSGKDSLRLHLASKIYLYDNLIQTNVPIFTDKMFGGYPIFFDLERGYQNIFNVFLVYLFGPYASHNILYLIIFTLGSLSMFVLLGRIKEGSFLSKLTFTFLYFYSFSTIFHIQHQNILFCIYLLPAILYFSDEYIKFKKISSLVYLSIIYNFLITFGALQTVFLNLVVQISFIYILNNPKIKFFKNLIILLLAQFLTSLPNLYFFLLMYLDSIRNTSEISLQGNLSIYHLWSYIYPFILGNREYVGQILNQDFLKHEFIIYFSASLIIFTLISLTKNIPSRLKFFLVASFLIYIFVNIIDLPPFNLFRYWTRGVYILNLAIILFAYSNFTDLKVIKFNLKNIYPIILLSIPLLISFINPDFMYLAAVSVKSSLYEFLFFIVIAIASFGSLFKYPKFIIYVFIFELLIAISFTNFNLFISKDEILGITKQINSYENTNDDYSLLKEGPSLSGYSQLAPKDTSLYTNSRYSFISFIYLTILCFGLSSLFLYIIKKYEFVKKF